MAFTKRRYTRAGRYLPTVIIVGSFVGSCTSSSPSYKTVTLCLHDKEGIAHFLELVQTVAASKNLRFIDGSAQSQRDLITTGAKMAKLHIPGSVINIGVDRDEHNLMMGGNLGLPTYQIALGFSGELSEDRQFAEELVKQLSAKWSVETVPAGDGALPIKDCPGSI